MMRSPRWWALAVRRPDATIHVESHAFASREGSILDRPLLRGVFVLVDTLRIGIRALSISARVSMGEEEAPTRRELGIAIGIAAVFFVGLFVVLPAVFVRGGGASGASSLLHNLREGVVRIAIFVGYILVISLLPDIRRVFQYHGAEHKVIAAHEAGAPLTRDGARPFSKVHVRCGTDFLFLVMLLAVLVFSLVGRPPLGMRIVSRIVLLPVVAALSYELLRLAARYERHPLIRLVTWPGRALQRITTREPDDDQLDVALAALDGLLRADKR